MAPSVQAGSRYTVERFDGTGNFAEWQARMEDLLTTLGLWDTLQEKKPDEIPDRAWEKALAEAVSNIRMCVSTGVINHITGLIRMCVSTGVSLSSQDPHKQNLCSTGILWPTNAGRGRSGESSHGV